MSAAIRTGYSKIPDVTNSCCSDFSLNWVIRRSSPKLVTALRSQHACGWASAWLWMKTVERSGSRPVEQHRRERQRRLAEVVRVVLDGDRVQVDDAEERV